nr:LysR substrate-binding domain-containing protein [Sansalvadorimonas sp. 2012CJ34-2]
MQADAASAVVDNMEAEALLVMTGRYIGFLPTHYAERWVRRGELKPLMPEQLCYESPFYLITKSGAYQSQVMQAFLDHFRECTATMQLKKSA